MTTVGESDPKPLFREVGASWYWVLAGPLSAASLIYIQWTNHVGISLLVPMIFLVLVSAFVALQVKAARIHTSVELTEDALRQGTETILVSEIVKVFPEAENSVKSGKPLARWQSARALGELVGVPRGRYGIGLKLTGGRMAQAWARRHRHLRDALTLLIEERMGPFVPEVSDEAGAFDGDDNESVL
ncbi:DUF3093 domain-containing protein [Mycobacterium asiaticum]|uniref:DUF3093 domain-containing protein n=1 Tax=Mycobacterium asiaticum TaxID=1790 RepID=A0A1A3MNL7_MYCAS|nr:DUF3093 domain-containing protein [Mycobacterium asiaticum]OBK10650.1 DUF3093 domain-containing protein [Mycobacterium asiaticum]